MANPRELEDEFRRLRIDHSRPGFYDHPEFLAQEQADPEFLQRYAQYVSSREYAPEYLSGVRETVTRLAEFLFRKLKKDGRLGACVDLSMALSRILEQRGIWNYIVKGCLTLQYDLKAGPLTTYLSPIVTGDNPAVVGHAWVVAPPFKIIDVTIARQKQQKATRAMLPDYVIAESTTPATFEAEDFLDQGVVAMFIRATGREPTLRDVDRFAPGVLDRARRFGCEQVTFPNARAKYTVCGISAPDVPLEELRSLRLSGKFAHDLYEEFCRVV